MSRVNVSLVLILAFSSICFGASLMERSIKQSAPRETLEPALRVEQELNCQSLFDRYHGLSARKIGKALYEQAFILSFDSDWENAKRASACSSLLLNGSRHWRIEAKNLSH